MCYLARTGQSFAAGMIREYTVVVVAAAAVNSTYHIVSHQHHHGADRIDRNQSVGVAAAEEVDYRDSTHSTGYIDKAVGVVVFHGDMVASDYRTAGKRSRTRHRHIAAGSPGNYHPIGCSIGGTVVDRCHGRTWKDLSQSCRSMVQSRYWEDGQKGEVPGRYLLAGLKHPLVVYQCLEDYPLCGGREGRTKQIQIL